MNCAQLERLVVKTLDEMKAQEIRVIDVRGKTAVTDLMIIASGTSTRHVKAIAEHVAAAARDAGVMPLGMEGEREGEWALVDLNDVVVHVMLPKTRDFYRLENLWLTGGHAPAESPEQGLPRRGLKAGPRT